MNNTENTTNSPRKSVNLHICGGNRTLVDFEQVVNVPTPPVEYHKKENANGERAVSYQPIAHHEVVERTTKFLEGQGFSIGDQVHSLARGNQHYFGLFSVEHPNRENTERGCVVGIRNSHDKTFPAGLCADDAPFVCDNLIFTNTIKLARRHTRNILNDLDFMINRAIGKLFNFWHGQDARINAYKEVELTNAQVNDIVIRLQGRCFAQVKIIGVIVNEIIDHPEFWDRNVNSLYNAFTEVYKGNLVALPNRSDALHSVLDSEVSFEIDNHVENVLDMEVVEGELVEV